MKLTVQTAVSDRPVQTEALEPWANREVQPVLARLREAANFTGRERSEVVTEGTGAATLLWESQELPQDATWSIESWVVACPSAGVSGYGDACQHATIVSRSGNITGTQFSRWSNTDVALPAPSFQYDTDTRKVGLLVQDAGGVRCRFVALVEVLEALGAS